MQIVTAILAVLSTLGGLFVAGLFLILLLASAANSSDAQLTQIKCWSLAVVLVALVATGAAIWSFVAGRPWLAISFGAAPALFSIIAFMILLRLQR